MWSWLAVCCWNAASEQLIIKLPVFFSLQARLLKVESERSKVGTTTFFLDIFSQLLHSSIYEFRRQQPLLFFTAFNHHVSPVLPLQVDQELARAHQLLKQSEDSRESLAQQVWLSWQFFRPMEMQLLSLSAYFCFTLTTIPRWSSWALSCYGRSRRGRSYRGLGWRLSSPAYCSMATAWTARRVKVDA